VARTPPSQWALRGKQRSRPQPSEPTAVKSTMERDGRDTRKSAIGRGKVADRSAAQSCGRVERAVAVAERSSQEGEQRSTKIEGLQSICQLVCIDARQSEARGSRGRHSEVWEMQAQDIL